MEKEHTLEDIKGLDLTGKSLDLNNPKNAEFLIKGTMLILACYKFIDEHNITCSETIYETDKIAEESLEFIDKIVSIVGFTKSE